MQTETLRTIADAETGKYRSEFFNILTKLAEKSGADPRLCPI